MVASLAVVDVKAAREDDADRELESEERLLPRLDVELNGVRSIR